MAAGKPSRYELVAACIQPGQASSISKKHFVVLTIYSTGGHIQLTGAAPWPTVHAAGCKLAAAVSSYLYTLNLTVKIHVWRRVRPGTLLTCISETLWRRT